MGNAVAMNFAQDGITNASIADNAFSDEQFDKDAVMKLVLGNRVHRAAANLPQTAAAPLFTITGGRILLTSIVGEVTTVIQTQANNTKLVANPTVGSDMDLCAVLNISADAVGDVYSITGTLSDAMVGAGVAVAAMAKGIIIPIGTIDLNCAASNTGQIKWTMHYVPIDEGASVAAA